MGQSVVTEEKRQSIMKEQGCSVSVDNGGLRQLTAHGCGIRLHQSWLSNVDSEEKGTLVSEEQSFVVGGWCQTSWQGVEFVLWANLINANAWCPPWWADFFFFFVRYALVVLVDLLSVLFNSICRVTFPWKNNSLIASIHEVEPLFSLKPKLMLKLIPIDFDSHGN